MPLKAAWLFSLAVMAQAANYSAEKLAVDGIEVIRLSDAAHHIEVSICPSVGNIAYDLRVNGKPILMSPPGGLAEWKAKPAQAGIPFLAPWANRMDPDSFWANGKKYLLNPDAADLRRDGNGLAIHGLLLFASGWQVIKLDAGDDSAEVVSRLEFWRHPEWMSQFPFAHTIEMTYRLSNGTLEVRTAIHNESRDPMPLLIGFHPWYQIPGVPRDDWKVHLPVREHYTLSSKSGSQPAKQNHRICPTRSRSQAASLTTCSAASTQTTNFGWKAQGKRISVRFGPKFPIAVVYAPEGSKRGVL